MSNPSHHLIPDVTPGVGKLVDHQISELCICSDPMITPFTPFKERTLNGQMVPSFGLSSCGYDIRCAPEWELFIPNTQSPVADILDPNHNADDFLQLIEADRVVLPPNTTVLTRSMETFDIPADVVGTCLAKSTWAREGITVLVTPLEPGWKGELVIEITNTRPTPVMMYAGVGIAQIQFERLSDVPNHPYGDGKYQNQTGVTRSKL